MGLKDVGAARDTAVVEIVHPVTGAPLMNGCDGTPITVTVYGPDSAHYRSILKAQQNRQLQKAARVSKMTLTADELEERALSLAVKTVAAWNLSLDDEEGLLECTEANVRRAFTEYPWLRAQISAVQEDVGAFLG